MFTLRCVVPGYPCIEEGVVLVSFLNAAPSHEKVENNMCFPFGYISLVIGFGITGVRKPRSS